MSSSLSLLSLFSTPPHTHTFFPTSILPTPNTQASSVLVISPLRETMAFWTRFRLCAGSTRTSATLAETQRGSPSSALALGRPVSISSYFHTTRKVTELCSDSVVLYYLFVFCCDIHFCHVPPRNNLERKPPRHNSWNVMHTCDW